MKRKTKIPDAYFDDQEFLVNDIDETIVIGILGKNPSADQLLKFELCTYISAFITKNALSLSDVEGQIGVNPSEISRIKNHHLERFTIDRLMKIYAALDSGPALAKVLESASEKIRRMIA